MKKYIIYHNKYDQTIEKIILDQQNQFVYRLNIINKLNQLQLDLINPNNAIVASVKQLDKHIFCYSSNDYPPTKFKLTKYFTQLKPLNLKFRKLFFKDQLNTYCNNRKIAYSQFNQALNSNPHDQILIKSINSEIEVVILISELYNLTLTSKENQKEKDIVAALAN